MYIYVTYIYVRNYIVYINNFQLFYAGYGPLMPSFAQHVQYMKPPGEIHDHWAVFRIHIELNTDPDPAF